MLTITIPSAEGYDERTNTFVTLDEVRLILEHSLLSVFKWEGRWHKSFLSSKNLTKEELLDYIECMTISHNVDKAVYSRLTRSNLDAITAYIQTPQTASTVTSKKPGRRNRQVITAELIYCWMVSLGIPFECQKWHLSRLLMLIEICSIQNSGGKKMSRSEILRDNAALNASRRSRLGTSG